MAELSFENLSDKHIWVIEDDPGAQFVFNETLETDYQVEMFSDLNGFDAAIANESLVQPDLVIADLRLGNKSFLSYLERNNKISENQLPFLVVSSVDDSETLRQCYQHGACDYLTKPFSKSELQVKIERIIQGEPCSTSDSELQFDPINFLLLRDGQKTPTLTQKEFQIFALLNGESENSLSRKELVQRIWGDVPSGSRTFDVHLVNLRRKLTSVNYQILSDQSGCLILLPFSASE